MNDYQIDAAQKRYDGIMRWIADEAPFTTADQKHLEANTPERAYYHYGYASALRDVLKLLGKFEPTT